MSERKRIVGLWDCDSLPVRLGPLLIFQQELLQFQALKKVEYIEVVFLGETAHLNREFCTIISSLNPEVEKLSFLTHKRDFVCEEDDWIWPENNNLTNTSCFDSYLAVQGFWQQTGLLFPLRSSQSCMLKAQKWLLKHVGDRPFVTVHLKNSSTDKQSNASQHDWVRFFRKCCVLDLPLRFVLVGNESTLPDIVNMTNVVVAKDKGSDLALDLALIENSAMFLGMASGPANRAILGDKPYLIWKHPGHHSVEMKRELGSNDRFDFSLEHQCLVQEWDKFENIWLRFENLVKHVQF